MGTSTWHWHGWIYVALTLTLLWGTILSTFMQNQYGCFYMAPVQALFCDPQHGCIYMALAGALLYGTGTLRAPAWVLSFGTAIDAFTWCQHWSFCTVLTWVCFYVTPEPQNKDYTIERQIQKTCPNVWITLVLLSSTCFIRHSKYSEVLVPCHLLYEWGPMVEVPVSPL